jgi:hypothetical protein
MKMIELRGIQMTLSIRELQETIEALSPDELARFRRWFEVFDAQRWDEAFEADVEAGKLDKVAEDALAEYRAGKATEL